MFRAFLLSKITLISGKKFMNAKVAVNVVKSATIFT